MSWRSSASDREPVRAAVRRFCDTYRRRRRGCRSTVTEHIPEHVGLGSGTQLALAVGVGLAAVCGIDADVREIASALRRGRRSGIGIAAFRAGGFVIDAGSRRQRRRSRRRADRRVAPRLPRGLVLRDRRPGRGRGV